MAVANAVFNQADLNNDQRLDLGEFRNLVANNVGAGANLTGLEAAGGYGSSSYQSSSYESSSNTGAVGGDLAYGAASLGGAGYGAAGYGAAGYGGAGYGGSSYESSSYSSSVGGDLAAAGGAVGLAGASGLSAANYSSSSQTTTVQQYETDAQGLFKDSNPQIVRRPAPGGNLTYTQNIKVRFLQPPPVPPPGPLIIKEVRPPQPPPPPPLRIRQQAPPLPQPAPLVLRERPPNPPASVAAQTVIRRLAAIPVPPRSVIIERLPAAPAKPRDIIIERWVPYGAQAKRQTIVQRAAAAQQYTAPRNVIIQYEAPQVRIVRQFQRLGVTQESPASYVARYGAQLLDAATLVQQARAAGVVEDISPPAVAASFTTSSAQYSSSAGNLGYDAAGAVGGVVGLEAGSLGLGGATAYESSSYSASSDVAGLGAGLGGATAYESSSYSASSDLSGLGAGLGAVELGGAGLAGASTYESSSYSATTGSALGGAGEVAYASASGY